MYIINLINYLVIWTNSFIKKLFLSFFCSEVFDFFVNLEISWEIQLSVCWITDKNVFESGEVTFLWGLVK